jgi:hypothetical protein
MEAGYSRAIPLRFLPAFPPKAKPAHVQPQREWEGGLSFLHWVRQELDEVGREQQLLLNLADGCFDVLDFWRGLPERTVLAVRSARNRRLYYWPEKHTGPGHPASYGALAPPPCDGLHKRITWQKREIPARGKSILMKFQVLDAFVREGLPEVPLFLFVVKGMYRKVGKKKPRYKHRKPSFYLVWAVQIDGHWQLPLPVETILAWLWQRWKLELTHREMKSGFGVGQKQCWNPRSTISSVQSSVWVYALLLLSAYPSWELLNAPPFLLVAGRTQSLGLSRPSGDNITLPFGEPLYFRHFGHEPLTTGSYHPLVGKRNPSCSLYPIPLPLLLTFNPKRPLVYPFCPFFLFPNFAHTAKVEERFYFQNKLRNNTRQVRAQAYLNINR